MIIDGVFPTEISEHASPSDKAVASFLKFIEQKLHISFLRNTHGIPEEMLAPLRLGEILLEKRIIKSFDKSPILPDELPIKSWYAICNELGNHQVAGSTWESDPDALMAALAEALERYLWFCEDDYFVDPCLATEDEISKKGAFIAVERFAGFTKEQRVGKQDRILRKDTQYLWVRAMSLVGGTAVYIPAQVVSGLRRNTQNWWHENQEPLIRQRTTIGLATWPTKTGARLAGALEAIERDAYMIAWLNQLTLPRISLTSLKGLDATLDRTIDICFRYRLKPHIIQLITDAPTHAIAVILEDTSGLSPRFSIGLRTHRSLVSAILKAMNEAQRAHRSFRFREKNFEAWDVHTSASKIDHYERIMYWGVPEHAKYLEFFVEGKEVGLKATPWENDNEEEHLKRITEWCRKSGLECVSVSLGVSAKNPTSFHVEQVVMPELQPAYLKETMQTFGGTRWKEVPKMFGYTPLTKAFADRPHPFA